VVGSGEQDIGSSARTFMCRPSLPARIARSLAAMAPIIGYDVEAVQNVLAPLVKLDDEEGCSTTNSGEKS
jgi:hypothetical protein